MTTPINSQIVVSIISWSLNRIIMVNLLWDICPMTLPPGSPLLSETTKNSKNWSKVMCFLSWHSITQPCAVNPGLMWRQTWADRFRLTPARQFSIAKRSGRVIFPSQFQRSLFCVFWERKFPPVPSFSQVNHLISSDWTIAEQQYSVQAVIYTPSFWH